MGNRTALRHGALPAGALVAGYHIEEQIGRGGMAVVYRAHDRRLDRRVALKVLLADAAAGDAFRRRFIRESRAAAAVDHPHIIPIHDAGEADGVLYIAMRYVSGGDLAALLNRHHVLPLDRVCDIICQAASALDAAHVRGLVHRDVKPANILLDAGTAGERADHAYLTDFGVTDRPPLSGGFAGAAAPEFVGTPRYVAPEQIEAHSVDGRADLYALACTAFHMLSGGPPFDGDNRAVLWAHLYELPPPLTSRRPDLPPSLDRVFWKALAKARRDRYGGCADFAAALRHESGLPAAGAATGASNDTLTGPISVPARQHATASVQTVGGPVPRSAGRRRPAIGLGEPIRAYGGPRQYVLVAAIAVTVVVALVAAGSLVGGRHAQRATVNRHPAASVIYKGGDAGPGCPAVPGATAAAAANAGGDGWIQVGGGPAACNRQALASRKAGQVTRVQDTFTWTFRAGHPASCRASLFIASTNPSSGIARYEVFAAGRLPIAQFSIAQEEAKGTWVPEGPWRVPGGVLRVQLTDRAAFPGDINHVTASAARVFCRPGAVAQ